MIHQQDNIQLGVEWVSGYNRLWVLMMCIIEVSTMWTFAPKGGHVLSRHLYARVGRLTARLQQSTGTGTLAVCGLSQLESTQCIRGDSVEPTIVVDRCE